MRSGRGQEPPQPGRVSQPPAGLARSSAAVPPLQPLQSGPTPSGCWSQRSDKFNTEPPCLLLQCGTEFPGGEVLRRCSAFEILTGVREKRGGHHRGDAMARLLWRAAPLHESSQRPQQPNDGIVCAVIDCVICVQAMPGWMRLIVTCSAGNRRASAKLNNTFRSLAWAYASPLT